MVFPCRMSKVHSIIEDIRFKVRFDEKEEKVPFKQDIRVYRAHEDEYESHNLSQ